MPSNGKQSAWSLSSIGQDAPLSKISMFAPRSYRVEHVDQCWKVTMHFAHTYLASVCIIADIQQLHAYRFTSCSSAVYHLVIHVSCPV